MKLRVLEEKIGKPVVFRSCWKCNSAHEHLKKENGCIIICYDCGCIYLKGKELNIEEVLNNETKR